jgi:succinate dehydrogenase / fumarate reductase membrane anchor subunit
MTQKDSQNPLVKVQKLRPSPDGLNHWIHQRISALVLILLGLWLVYSLSYHSQDPYNDIVTWLANPWTAAGMLLFTIAVTYHAVLGIQVVVEDYIHSSYWRSLSLFLLKLILFVVPILSIFLLIKIGLLGQK